MRQLRFALALVSLLAIFATHISGAERRTWTDVSGRTMEAEFVRLENTNVVFLRDGKEVKVPISRLSPADRDLVVQFSEDNRAGSADSEDTADSPPARSSAKPGKFENRTWTDNQGQQVTARFVRMSGDKVVLSRAGRNMMVPFFNLGELDQDYVRGLLIEQGEEDQIPTTPPPKSNSLAGGPAGAAPGMPNLNGPGMPRGMRGGMPMPGAGGMPSMPGAGGMPAMPGAAGMPAMPTLGGMPGAPGGGGMPAAPAPGQMPSMPGMGGIASAPGPAGMPAMPGAGGMPHMPGAGGGGMPSMPAAGGMPSMPGAGGMSSMPGAGAGGMPAMPGAGGMPSPGSLAGNMGGPPGMTGSSMGSGLPDHPRLAPDFGPPALPQIPTIEWVSECSDCKATFTQSEASGKTHCPKCGIPWVNQGGKPGTHGDNSTKSSNFSFRSSRGAFKLVGLIVGVVVSLLGAAWKKLRNE